MYLVGLVSFGALAGLSWAEDLVMFEDLVGSEIWFCMMEICVAWTYS